MKNPNPIERELNAIRVALYEETILVFDWDSDRNLRSDR
jgi:hypothetical protein